jgi:hypothetical protein
MGKVCQFEGCLPGWGACVNENPLCLTDLSSNPEFCGGCGHSCPQVANGQRGCKNGVCGIGACNPGFADCNLKPNDGCEANLATDDMNCGGCGLACVVGKCQNGVCK